MIFITSSASLEYGHVIKYHTRQFPIGISMGTPDFWGNYHRRGTLLEECGVRNSKEAANSREWMEVME